jgi:hypothetical protein
LLKVIPHPQTISGNKEGLVKDGGDEVDEDGYGPILFPALMGSDGDDDATAGATAASKQSKLRQGEVILVNPHAFDAKETICRDIDRFLVYYLLNLLFLR